MASDGWDGVRDRAVDALIAHPRGTWYVCTYRGIPKAIAADFNIGLVEGTLLEDLLDVLEQSPKVHLEGRPWVAFFCEDIEGKPLAVELRTIDGKEFHRLNHPRAKVHAPFFGLTQAFPLIAERGQVALVEGAFDALTFATITKFPVLGVMTKYPSKLQQRFLIRWARLIHLFLNRDDQGKNTANRIAKFWPKKHPVIVRNSLWWEDSSLGLGMETDLNDLLQQHGISAVKTAVMKGLRG